MPKYPVPDGYRLTDGLLPVTSHPKQPAVGSQSQRSTALPSRTMRIRRVPEMSRPSEMESSVVVNGPPVVE